MDAKKEEMLAAYLGLQMSLRHRDHDSIMYALDLVVQEAEGAAEMLAVAMVLKKFAAHLIETAE